MCLSWARLAVPPAHVYPDNVGSTHPFSQNCRSPTPRHGDPSTRFTGPAPARGGTRKPVLCSLHGLPRAITSRSRFPPSLSPRSLPCTPLAAPLPGPRAARCPGQGWSAPEMGRLGDRSETGNNTKLLYNLARSDPLPAFAHRDTEQKAPTRVNPHKALCCTPSPTMERR